MSKSKRERSDASRSAESSIPLKKARITGKPSSSGQKLVTINNTSKYKGRSLATRTKSVAAKPRPSSNTKKAPRKHEHETEVDSDPIIESDTQSESGADDGVSWPSDPEEESGVALIHEDKSLDERSDLESEGGGVELKSDHVQANGQETSTNGPSTSRESHQKQRVLAQERKAAKPNAEVFARAKKIWERLRLQSHVPLPERKKLVAELFEIITGRIKDFVLKHDASRVIQTALKYGNLEQRKMIARELKGTYCELAQSKFAKHAIGKILVHGDDEIRDIVIPEFYGSVRRLIKHPEAAWILDDVYRGAATPQQKAILLREWYGAEFAIFKPSPTEKPSSDLAGIFKTSPEKQTTILRYLFELINQLIQKKTTGFTMLHDAMLQYYINVRGTDTATEFLEIVKGDEEGDLLKNLAFTKSGARLVSLFFAYSSAKDRKQLLKAYKGVIPAMAFDAHAHKVLLVALDVVDDTRLTGKSIYGELLPLPSDSDEAVAAAHVSIVETALHLYGRSSLLYPFVNKLQSILPKETEKLVVECQQIRKQTSKKDPELRCKELAKVIAPQLLAAMATQIPTLLAESFGCQFILEVLLGCTSDVVDANSRDPVLTALINAIQDSKTKDTLATAHVGRMLKSLVQSGHFDPATKTIHLCNPPLGFADLLFEAIGPELVDWATGSNSFVVVGMAESQDLSPQNRQALSGMLKNEKKKIKAAAGGIEGAKANKGAEILLGKIEKGEI